jgi:mRNA interferase MazF
MDPAVGSELAKTRPALIVQNDQGNRVSASTIVAPLTSAPVKRTYPFEVQLPPDVTPRPSRVRCDQLRVVDRQRLLGDPIAVLDSTTMDEVDAALRVSLGLK